MKRETQALTIVAQTKEEEVLEFGSRRSLDDDDKAAKMFGLAGDGPCVGASESLQIFGFLKFLFPSISRHEFRT